MSTLLSTSGVMRALRAFDDADRSLRISMTRLSTGRRINSGADDPAGLIATEALSAEIRMLEAEQANAARIDSYAAIAEGGLSQVSDLSSELAGKLVAAANSGGISEEEQAAYQTEIDSLVTSIERAAGPAMERLEGLNLPDDQVGELSSELSTALTELRSVASGGEHSVSSGEFEEAMSRVSTVVSKAAELRGAVGAYQRYSLEADINSSRVATENLMESRSRIADTEYALETSNLNRAQILRKAATQALRITRALPENVLDLLSQVS